MILSERFPNLIDHEIHELHENGAEQRLELIDCNCPTQNPLMFSCVSCISWFPQVFPLKAAH